MVRLNQDFGETGAVKLFGKGFQKLVELVVSDEQLDVLSLKRQLLVLAEKEDALESLQLEIVVKFKPVLRGNSLEGLTEEGLHVVTG